MSWTLHRPPQQIVKTSISLRLLTAACILALATAILAGAALTPWANAAQASSPRVVGNFLVDQDQNLQFSQNKQNEPAITRDPLTGALIAGANDELEEPLCPGTATPLASPCPFAPGVPISAYYRSTDNGKTWTGAFLPGFNTIGRVSGYDASLADPFPEFGCEQATVSRSYDDGLTCANPVAATSTDNKSNFDDHDWVAVDHFSSSPHFGRVYLNWAVFCNTCSGNGNVKLYVAHSDDEGRTWSQAVQVSAANNNFPQGFRETGQMAVSSNGTVEAFWTENADSTKLPSLQVVATSTDGGQTFTKPITIVQVTDYPLTGTPFDVVDLFNRVPGMIASVSGRNAFFPEASIAPNGTVSHAFDALTRPPANNPFQTGVQVYDNYF